MTTIGSSEAITVGRRETITTRSPDRPASYASGDADGSARISGQVIVRDLVLEPMEYLND